MKRAMVILAMAVVLSVASLGQATTTTFHWWTDVAGSNVDSSGNTWNVYYANGNPNPQLGSGAWDKWSLMSYSGGQWGSGYPGYDSSKTFTADGYYSAPGVTIQAGQSGTYSWQGSASAAEYNDATLTFGKIVNGTWSSMTEIVVPVYSSTDLSTISALQNISLNAGDQLTLYIRKVGGGWLDCSMASATINFVPEPATLIMLCLGGLSLVRRKAA